jgi:hypothetical protein
MRRTCHDGEVMDAATRLGVPPDASTGTVRAAFARQVRAVHPDIAEPGHADPGTEVAALIAARDHLLARAQSLPHPQTGPVVFVQHRHVVGSLRAVVSAANGLDVSFAEPAAIRPAWPVVSHEDLPPIAGH